MPQLTTCSDAFHHVLDNFFSFSLYLAYFLFFSPYLLPLLSFLLPLLLSTSLLTLLFPNLNLNLNQEPNPTLTTFLTHIFDFDSDVSNSCSSEDDDEIFFDTSGKELPHEENTLSLQRDGSMKKEKEWKRTLACKLYEERMTFKLCEDRDVVEGAEEMDLLWEAYEADASKDGEFKTKKNNKEEDDEEEEEEEENVRLCCLQALRMSTGKMNLGVRRPNLEKISKAFKGIGLFRRSSRRSRKV